MLNFWCSLMNAKVVKQTFIIVKVFVLSKSAHKRTLKP